ncbi:hypothetical protein LptCag_1880 [Leptospirillum ferriphilum]|uniref:Uncharacterized protein n=1 Tax=Leptospirillum ferriphilum TaxID=178606 RepID=A0A094W9K5_9BACT|nr:hypothetical protein LptCag_1880 [Leptospirillum ferriphilum]
MVFRLNGSAWGCPPSLVVPIAGEKRSGSVRGGPEKQDAPAPGAV